MQSIVDYTQGARLKAPSSLGLYVHFPWCIKKCPYCDFNSHEVRGEIQEQEYIQLLIRDLEQALPQIWGRKITSIFFGGGTPSLLSAQGLDWLLAQIRMLLPLDPYAEITLEANPGAFEVEKFKYFRQSGINRLSIGVQSFNHQHLKSLGRIHDDRQARVAIETAQRVFDNFNVDLMYALPGQSMRELEKDIVVACAYAPPHISAYHLTLEPNTLFFAQPPKLPDDDLAADMQIHVEQLLEKHGYQHYETSAFALPGKQAQHNLNYWQYGDYLGVGAGAHSKLSSLDRIVRQVRYKQPREYMERVTAGSGVFSEDEVLVSARPFEFMMNALRLIDGVESKLFEERTGLPLLIIQRELARAESAGFIERDLTKMRPTLRGQRFLNDALQIFL